MERILGHGVRERRGQCRGRGGGVGEEGDMVGAEAERGPVVSSLTHLLSAYCIPRTAVLGSRGPARLELTFCGRPDGRRRSNPCDSQD